MPEISNNGHADEPVSNESASDESASTPLYGFETRSVHAGQRPDPYTGARAMPIYQTTSYVFEDSAHAAAIFNLHEYGNTYSRIMNPTVAAFEERVASLEGGVGAVATASGQAAQLLAIYTMLQPGDHIVASRALYGGTTTQFKYSFQKFGIEVSFVDPDDPDAWRAALRDNTKVLYGETIGNPSGNVLDLETVADVAHQHGAALVVDNTFATPYLCRPLEWGADVVVHSATKFIGGHGTSIGGVVVDSGRFDWANGRFPNLTEPSPAYHGLAFQEAFGMYGYVMKLRAESLRDLGACLSPFNAFLFLLGLETLPLRMERHVANALAVARFLQGHPMVEGVRYPGLADSPYAPLVRKYLPLGAGAVFAFDIRGGRPAGLRFIESLELFSHLANVGDAKSLVIHPGSTTHRQLSEDELAAMGLGPGTIRLSIGLETEADLLRDLGHALAAAERGLEVGAGLVSPTAAALPAVAATNAYQQERTIRKILDYARTIAIVGLSPQVIRASYFVGYYLNYRGYRIVPVNPSIQELFGQKAYPSLADIPFKVDVVDVFRRPDAAPALAREAVAIGARAFWMQFGVISPEAARIAEEGGLDVVMDRCMKVEHARYLGQMHWFGLNTGVISSRRRKLTWR